MDDDPEISSWLKRIISKQSNETSSTDFFTDQKEKDDFELDNNDLSDNDDLDLNFFKKYRKKDSIPSKENDENDDDVDISHFFHKNESIGIENDYDNLNSNDNVINSDNTETLNEARRLLSSWADQTETFQRQSKQVNLNQRNNNGNNRNESSPNRVVQYRKLEMPMMVAKKAPELKVNDPTLKMEERLKHVREMREKRLEKQKLKQNQQKTPQRDNIRQKITLKVTLTDIDTEIRNFR